MSPAMPRPGPLSPCATALARCLRFGLLRELQMLNTKLAVLLVGAIVTTAATLSRLVFLPVLYIIFVGSSRELPPANPLPESL